MVSQRGSGVEARKPERTEKPRPAAKVEPAEPRARKPRLGFAERRALETLPKRMAELEAAIARHQAALADPGLYARDRARFDAATAGIGTAQAELAAAEEEWLRLEMLREEIEG